MQAEAFAPDQLQSLVRVAIVERFDLDRYALVLEEERAERGRVSELLDGMNLEE